MAKDKPNFGSLLDETPTEVDRPQPLPEGSYLWVVQGMPRYDKSSKKGTEFTEFTVKALRAGSDVDPEQLAEMGGIEDKTQKLAFYHTEGSIYRLDEFHEHCGIDLSEAKSRRQRNEDCVNAQFVGFIRHEASQDGQTTFGRIGRTAPADEFDQDGEAEAA